MSNPFSPPSQPPEYKQGPPVHSLGDVSAPARPVGIAGTALLVLAGLVAVPTLLTLMGWATTRLSRQLYLGGQPDPIGLLVLAFAAVSFAVLVVALTRAPFAAIAVGAVQGVYQVVILVAPLSVLRLSSGFGSDSVVLMDAASAVIMGQLLLPICVVLVLGGVCCRRRMVPPAGPSRGPAVRALVATAGLVLVFLGAALLMYFAGRFYETVLIRFASPGIGPVLGLIAAAVVLAAGLGACAASWPVPLGAGVVLLIAEAAITLAPMASQRLVLDLVGPGVARGLWMHTGLVLGALLVGYAISLSWGARRRTFAPDPARPAPGGGYPS